MRKYAPYDESARNEKRKMSSFLPKEKSFK